MPNLQSRRAPRSLPWDVLLVVFEVADAPSLALLGRVSYDFLVATAPHLYRDVVLESLPQISRMFCERKEEEKVVSSRINPFLSLDKLRTLTLDFLSTPTSSSDVLDISFDRISSLVPLDSLFISLPQIHPERYLGPVQLHFLRALNPRRCEYRMDHEVGRDPSTDQGRVLRVHKEEGCSLYLWSRIETVDLIGCIPYTPLDYHGECNGEVAFLPYSIFPQVQFRFHVLSLLDESCYTPEEFVTSLQDGYYWYGYHLMEDGSMVLVVRSEEEKEEVEAAVALTSTLKKKFSVVLEE